MRILVTGALGLLGYDVVNEALARGDICVGCARSAADTGIAAQLAPGNYSYIQLDICDHAALAALFADFKPEAVIHCAAWRNAVTAQLPENRAAVYAVNAAASGDIAALCARYGSKLIYISTDYVYNGSGTTPWPADDILPEPLNVYGCSKLEGERAIACRTDAFYIVRTAWLFGVHGGNFVDTMLRLGRTHASLSVVNDQIGAPAYTKDLARLLLDMARSDRYGYYNAVNSGGFVSRCGFAAEIFRQAGLRVRLNPVSTAGFTADALPRPLNERLDLSALPANGFRLLPDWKDALSRYLKEMNCNG